MISLTKVFVSVTMSLDGYLAPPGLGLTDPDAAGRDAWIARWSQLQDWVFHQAFFRKNLGFPGETGETGGDDKLLRDVFGRTGTTIIGKRMFDAGEASWPEDAPFHTPVFVVTHEKRAPWVRPGGTTFHFVNDTAECPGHSSYRSPAAPKQEAPPVCDGIESTLRQARAVAGGRDIRIGGGGDTIAQFLRAGLVDELHIALSPVFLGGGVRMFDEVEFGRLKLTPIPAPASTRVSHLRYKVERATDHKT